jgi:hypothetical protein
VVARGSAERSSLQGGAFTAASMPRLCRRIVACAPTLPARTCRDGRVRCIERAQNDLTLHTVRRHAMRRFTSWALPPRRRASAAGA